MPLLVACTAPFSALAGAPAASGDDASGLRAAIEAKVPGERERLKALKAQHGNKVRPLTQEFQS